MKSYYELEQCVEKCRGKVNYIGITHLGFPIPMVTKGMYPDAKILLVGGVHAREYITSYLLCELMREYRGHCRIDCIPALNIDGIFLSRLGENLFPPQSEVYKELMHLNGKADFSQWKANIRGVDLNVNFNADWGTGEFNLRRRGSENYIGEHPESENETKAIVELLHRNRYNIVIAYHSKGEEIYYGYGRNKKNKEEAQKVADFLGYELKMSHNSAGGLKDYVVKSMNRFGLTIEVGEDRFSHPYPMEELPNLIKKHKGSLELFCSIGEELCKKNLCWKP